MNIDDIIGELNKQTPTIRIEQQKKSKPGDDDGIWFITVDGLEGEIQIESPDGEPPFMIECDWSNRRLILRHGEDVPRIIASMIKKRKETTQRTSASTVRSARGGPRVR
jgi:tRNA U34 2-thiouridine synthase MnmA/TrmU